MQTRTNYDTENFNQSTQMSMYACNYQTDPNRFINNTYINSKSDHDQNYGNLINVDSVLRGYRNKANKNVSNQPCEQIIANYQNTPSCSNEQAQYIRMDQSPRNIKDQENLRLDFPLYDPQAHILDMCGVNTRLQAKDNFVPVFQAPLDGRNLWGDNSSPIPAGSIKQKTNKRTIRKYR